MWAPLNFFTVIFSFRPTIYNFIGINLPLINYSLMAMGKQCMLLDL